MAEANCTSCVAGKYHSGSGLNTAFWLSILAVSDDNGKQMRLCRLSCGKWLRIRETAMIQDQIEKVG